MQDPDLNPYASPKASVIDPPVEGPELASLGLRLGGALIDALLMMVIVIPLGFALGFMNISDIMAGIKPSLIDNIKAGTMGFLIFMIVQGFFLNATGQTVGKKILGTKIVTMDNQKPEFMKLILLRYFSIHAINQVPILGGLFSLANAIFIFFGNERQCLHDKFASTKVVMSK